MIVDKGTLGRIFAVFLPKVAAIGVSEFQLEDELADEALFVIGRIGSEDGQAACLDLMWRRGGRLSGLNTRPIYPFIPKCNKCIS
jgi:hypothetical protein